MSKIDPAEKGIISIKVDINFSNFNQPVKIEAPKEFKGLEEILEKILEEILKPLIPPSLIPSPLIEARKKAEDAMIWGAIAPIRTIAVMIEVDFGSYENLCTEPPDSTLNEKAPEYGNQLSSLEKDIQKHQGVLDLVCLDSATSFCLHVDLISPGRGRYCADSAGRFKEIAENQTCLGTGTPENPYRCP